MYKISILALFLGIFLQVLAITGVRAESAKTDAVMELMEVLDMDGVMDRMANASSQPLTRAVKQRYPDVTPEVLTEIDNVVRETLAEMKPELMKLQGQILAKHFTLEEIREITAFHKSPVGQKSLRLMPEITQETVQLILPKVQEMQPRIQESVLAILKENGYAR